MDENLKNLLDTDIGRIAEEGKAKSEKRNRLLIFSAAIIVILVGACAALMPYVEKQNIYNEYKQRLEQGDYSIGVETGFEELGDFKDSAEFVLETRYQRAMGYMNDSTDDNAHLYAYQLFAKVGDYKDAPEQATEAKYLYAKDLLARGKYDMAERYFTGLGDYKDSTELALEVRYQQAIQFMNNEQYMVAYQLFAEVGDYKDAPKRASEATEMKYRCAKELFESGSYNKAAVYFQSLGDYKDSAELLKKCQE